MQSLVGEWWVRVVDMKERQTATWKVHGNGASKVIRQESVSAQVRLLQEKVSDRDLDPLRCVQILLEVLDSCGPTSLGAR